MATIEEIMNEIKYKNPQEPEFYQAVHEILLSIYDFLYSNKQYLQYKIIERIVEPERIIIFRIPWIDDKGKPQVNRGFRVEMNSLLGPYKGGFRFHPSVNLSIIKFLAFEQMFKNSLTLLPIGSGKGGADFNPKGCSRNEIINFCQSFVNEFYKYAGEFIDIPGSDIGAGQKEMDFLFSQLKRIKNTFTGTIAGKSLHSGGSLLREQAPGYSVIYFAERMLNTQGDSIRGKRCVVSGSGIVAQYAIEQIIQQGGRCVSVSDSDGTIYDKNGITEEKLAYIKELKNIHAERIVKYAERFDCEYLKGKSPWSLACDIAIPAATQNEISEKDAHTLLSNGCMCVSEAAEMPCSPEAAAVFRNAKILYAPAKAANAGGVAVSSFELSQNSAHTNWTKEEVNSRLEETIIKIHDECVEYGNENGYINYSKGANIAAFVRIADAMLEQGLV